MFFFIWICLQGGVASMVHGTCWYDGVYLCVQGHIVSVTGTLASGVQSWRCCCQSSANASPAVSNHSILVTACLTNRHRLGIMHFVCSVCFYCYSAQSDPWDPQQPQCELRHFILLSGFSSMFWYISQNGSPQKGSGTVTGRNSFTKYTVIHVHGSGMPWPAMFKCANQ